MGGSGRLAGEGLEPRAETLLLSSLTPSEELEVRLCASTPDCWRVTVSSPILRAIMSPAVPLGAMRLSRIFFVAISALPVLLSSGLAAAETSGGRLSADASEEPATSKSASGEQGAAGTPARRHPGDMTTFGELIAGAGLASVVGGPNIGLRYHFGRNFSLAVRAMFDFLYDKRYGEPFVPEVRAGASLGARLQAPIDRSTLFVSGQFGLSVGWTGAAGFEQGGRIMMGLGYTYQFPGRWVGGVELSGPAPLAATLSVGRVF